MTAGERQPLTADERLAEIARLAAEGLTPRGHRRVTLERIAALAGASPAAEADPPCPYCGMTAQVEPSRSELGRWMCHGCADTFDFPASGVSDTREGGRQVSPRDWFRRPIVHELKCYPIYFVSVIDGTKTFEVRYDDRGFNRGDELWLREFSPTEGYTGREHRTTITYVFSGMDVNGVKENYKVLALAASPVPAVAGDPEHDENCWIACPHDTPPDAGPGSRDTKEPEA